MIDWIKNVLINLTLQPGIWAFLTLNRHSKETVKEDLCRIPTTDTNHIIRSLNSALKGNRRFRSILLYRINTGGNWASRAFFRIFRIMHPESPGIEISGEIEGGLRIIHNCCVIHVEHAGKNLSVGPFVVIGKSHDAAPVIGDNVTICANSTVIGGIHIGDNALIGAASLVRKDVEANTMVGGNPMRIIKRIDV